MMKNYVSMKKNVHAFVFGALALTASVNAAQEPAAEQPAAQQPAPAKKSYRKKLALVAAAVLLAADQYYETGYAAAGIKALREKIGTFEEVTANLAVASKKAAVIAKDIFEFTQKTLGVAAALLVEAANSEAAKTTVAAVKQTVKVVSAELVKQGRVVGSHVAHALGY